MPAKMTKQEFLDKVIKKNPNVEILSEFKDRKEKVLRKCLICGDIREVSPINLLAGRGCKVCASNKMSIERRKSPEKFSQEMKEKHPEIQIMSEYVSCGQYVKCKCLIDGYEWETSPNSLRTGSGCPECYRRKHKIRTQEEFVEEIHNKFPNIEVLSNYMGIESKIHLRCSVCGYEWEVIANNFLNRHKKDTTGCPTCCKRNYITEEKFLERLKEKEFEDIEYVSGYHGIKYKAKFKCKKCGHEWEVAAGKILKGCGCPRCHRSSGETKVRKFLQKKGINFLQEYIFDDCRYKNCLRFDFYLSDYNCVIEVMGEQHYRPVKFGGTKDTKAEENFEKTKIRDSIKKQYCQDHSIKFIEIKYPELDNLEEILDKEIA